MSFPRMRPAGVFGFGVLLAGSLCLLRANDPPARGRSVSPKPAPPSASIRVDVQAIMVPVTVTDAMDRPVHDLKKEDFHLFEDGARQEIVSLSTVDVPASVGVIFDASSSMARKLGASVDAVDQFFKTSIPGDEFLLVRFNDRPHFITGFTPDTADISGWLHATRPHGLTALNDAIYLGIQKMKAARNGRKVLLVLSDGGDNNSSYSKRQLQRLVREADVQIYSISLLEGSSLLESISGETGGRMYRVRTAAELPNTIDKLSREIRSRYVLTYYSNPPRNDGKYRRLNVAVADPMLRVSWRRGYYAPVE